MAYMNQEKKKQLAPAIKAICKKHGVKATLSVRNHSSLVLNITEGSIDFIGSYLRVALDNGYDRQHMTKNIEVNPYWYHQHFDDRALAFLEEVIPAMNQGNHDRSDVQSDYFDVGWYIDVNIGKWNKPYILSE